MVAAVKRRPLAEEAADIINNVTPINEKVVMEEQETALSLPMDMVTIKGTFDGFEVSYTTYVDSTNVNINLAQVTDALRANGFEPIKVAPPVAQVPSGNSTAAQNGGTRPAAQTNRGYAGGQPRGGGYAGGRPQGGSQQEDFGDQSWWHNCGHEAKNIRRNKYGSLECGAYEDDYFEGCRPWDDPKGEKASRFYCTTKEPRRG